jgi:predicted nucleotidyltransferase
MIPKDELDKAIEIARKYGVGELYLIGSALHKEPEKVNDYDFAVKDVPTGNFFRFYGELIRAMSKSVDLIDLSGKITKFKAIILREGKLIYDRTTA